MFLKHILQMTAFQFRILQMRSTDRDWVVHSSVVEKLSVDKTLPPDNFYLVKAPSSEQLSVVDKKNLDFYEILLFAYLLFTGMHIFITI